jgi:hypothetical protein
LVEGVAQYSNPMLSIPKALGSISNSKEGREEEGKEERAL